MRYEFNAEDAYRFGREQGIKAIPRGRELRFRVCPYCREKTDDKNTFAINLETGQFKCLRATCGAHGNMITLARDFDFSLGTEVDEYFKPSRRFRNIRKYPRPETKEPAVAFMESRGISREVTVNYAITTKDGQDNVIAFPFYDEHSVLQFVKYRKTDFDSTKDKNKEWCLANCKPILFGMDWCSSIDSPVLVLTEGQIDSLSVVEAFHGEVNAVSVPTGANGFTWVPYCWDFMKQFDVLIVFGDRENGRITLLEEMRQRFSGTVKHVRPEDYKDCKDANELLIKYGPEAVMVAVENAVPVFNDRILDLSEVPRKSSVEQVIDTGIKQLNRLTGGFPLGRVVVITGQSGKGKSTLSTQFAIRAADQGFGVFCYSGELSSWEVAGAIDRQVAGSDYLVKEETPLGFTEYKVRQEQRENVTEWAKNKIYLYNNEIVGDGDEDSVLIKTVTDAVMQYGCKVVILDNLMSAMLDDVRLDLYRQQTRFIGKLHTMAASLNILIILIAHQRKRQANEFSNDDIAGSSNITNLVDIVLNYAEPVPELVEEVVEDARGKKKTIKKPKLDPDRDGDRVLQVTKNRITGALNERGIKLWFQPSSLRISEDRNVFDWKLSWQSGTDGFVTLEESEYDEIPF